MCGIVVCDCNYGNNSCTFYSLYLIVLILAFRNLIQIIAFISAILGKTGTKADIFCRFMERDFKVNKRL